MRLSGSCMCERVYKYSRYYRKLKIKDEKLKIDKEIKEIKELKEINGAAQLSTFNFQLSTFFRSRQPKK